MASWGRTGSAEHPKVIPPHGDRGRSSPEDRGSDPVPRVPVLVSIYSTTCPLAQGTDQITATQKNLYRSVAEGEYKIQGKRERNAQDSNNDQK